MRYVVGYSANARGHDAVNLAVSLALGRGASLDLVLVVPEVQQFGARPRTEGRTSNICSPSRPRSGSTRPWRWFRPVSRRRPTSAAVIPTRTR